HQCVSEDAWFRGMLGIDVGGPPLPPQEARIEFLKRYAEDSGRRITALRHKSERWWEESTTFFDVERSRAWVMIRRLTHTSHHRGQQMAMLRMLGRALHSNYGPTADTGGLMQNHAPTIYAYANLEVLLEGAERGGATSPLPGGGGKPVTERPD
ncbi:MAG: DinB family protein, partial [Acidobacteriota bacterium]